MHRRGADAPAAWREEEEQKKPGHCEGLLITIVGCRDGRKFAVPVDATLEQLHQAIAERHPDAAASHRVIAGKVLSNTLVRPGAPVRVQGSSDTPGDTGEPGKRVLSSWGLSKGDQIKVLVTLLDDVEALKAQASPRMMMVAAVGGVRRMPRAREKVWMGVQRALQVHAAATMDWGVKQPPNRSSSTS